MTDCLNGKCWDIHDRAKEIHDSHGRSYTSDTSSPNALLILESTLFLSDNALLRRSQLAGYQLHTMHLFAHRCHIPWSSLEQ